MHPQGCQILSLDPLLFGFNHMPVNWCIRQDSHLQTLRSKRRMIINFTTDAEMVGCLGFAPSSRRLRAGTSLSKFATHANAKAELNRRSQGCEDLTGTGISRRVKWLAEP